MNLKSNGRSGPKASIYRHDPNDSFVRNPVIALVEFAAACTNVLYLRPLIQGRISVSSGSWFSPRSAVPPHNGVGDWCPKKVRCEVAWVQAHRHSTARSSGHRPDGTSLHPDGRIRFGLSHAGSSSLVHAKVVPSRQMRVMMTASFRAVATMAFFIPLRATSRIAHALSGEKRDTRWIRMLAAS